MRRIEDIALIVIPAKRSEAKRRAGTHFNTCQISQWVPDRAHVPNGEAASGASGMTCEGSPC